MSVWHIYNSAVIISLLCAYVVQSFLPKHEQQIIRNVLSRENTPAHIKTQAQQVVSYHYIPLALSESRKFVTYYKIPQKMQQDYNSVAVNGMIKGIHKYNWTRENTNLSTYLKKYILGEMYKNMNAHNVCPMRSILEIENIQHLQTQSYPMTHTHYLYDRIIENTEKLTPREKRLFFTVYNKYTLRRTIHSVERICQLNGISNEETYRNELNNIINKLKAAQ